jgi:hypothetical protein
MVLSVGVGLRERQGLGSVAASQLLIIVLNRPG